MPDLLLAIKSVVDLDPRPGQFLVTGSSQLSANRRVSETLAGRIERFELWPFSQGELAGGRETFLDLVLAGTVPEHASSMTKRDYLTVASTGSYPEVIQRQPHRRATWFDAYVETVVEREGPAISASPRTGDLPRLLRLVAARQATVLNVADLARDARLPERSVYRYLDVLEAVFLVRRIPAWSPNLAQREVRAPKIVVTDSGLAVALRGLDVDALVRPEVAQGADGAVLEGFVLTELIRQLSWSGPPREAAALPRSATRRDRRGLRDRRRPGRRYRGQGRGRGRHRSAGRGPSSQAARPVGLPLHRRGGAAQWAGRAAARRPAAGSADQCAVGTGTAVCVTSASAQCLVTRVRRP